MPIRLLLAKSKLPPDETQKLTSAFDQALRSLHLVDRNDPLSKIVKKQIVEIGAIGDRDATQIAEIAVKQLHLK